MGGDDGWFPTNDAAETSRCSKSSNRIWRAPVPFMSEMGKNALSTRSFWGDPDAVRHSGIAVGMILELEKGFGGLIHISPQPTRQAAKALETQSNDTAGLDQ